MQRHQLSVRVSDALVLDAGWWEETLEETISGEPLSCRLIHPPDPTMYKQVLTYLDRISSARPFSPKAQFDFVEVGLATVALCLRWGTYFAVLVDRTKPLWAQAEQAAVSMIGDREMARINIEASAALAQWIELMRTDEEYFRRLVKAALMLPMLPPRTDGRRDQQLYRRLSMINSARGRRDFFALLAAQCGDEWLVRKRAGIALNPARGLANGLIAMYWRNESGVEDIHAGTWTARPLTQRRMTFAQEDALVRRVAEGLAPGMHAVYNVVRKESDDSWVEQALALALHFSPPSSWSLSEPTARVLLEGPEP